MITRAADIKTNIDKNVATKIVFFSFFFETFALLLKERILTFSLVELTRVFK